MKNDLYFGFEVIDLKIQRKQKEQGLSVLIAVLKNVIVLNEFEFRAGIYVRC